MRVSTAPPAHCGQGAPHSLLHPTPCGVQPNMPPTRPRYAGVHRASCPLRAGGTTLSSPPHSVGCLTQHATNKTPLCGCPPRLLPIAGGGTTFSSPPHSVGCLTQHATHKTPLCGCPPRLLPIAGGGTTCSAPCYSPREGQTRYINIPPEQLRRPAVPVGTLGLHSPKVYATSPDLLRDRLR